MRPAFIDIAVGDIPKRPGVYIKIDLHLLRLHTWAMGRFWMLLSVIYRGGSRRGIPSLGQRRFGLPQFPFKVNARNYPHNNHPIITNLVIVSTKLTPATRHPSRSPL